MVTSRELNSLHIRTLNISFVTTVPRVSFFISLSYSKYTMETEDHTYRIAAHQTEQNVRQSAHLLEHLVNECSSYAPNSAVPS